MKCPNCDFIERDELWGEPATCPKCGAIYEKALKVKELRAKLAGKKQQETAAETARIKAEKAAQPAGEKREAPAMSSAPVPGEVLYRADGTPVFIGSPPPPPTKSGTGTLKTILMLTGIAVVLMLGSRAIDSYRGYADRAKGGTPTATPAQTNSRSAQDADLRRIKIERLAREEVKRHLKDPDTAQFRNQRGGCGEVNAKNLFGGYTGYKRFMFSGGGLLIFDGDPALEEGAFEESWIQLCGPTGKLTFPG